MKHPQFHTYSHEKLYVNMDNWTCEAVLFTQLTTKLCMYTHTVHTYIYIWGVLQEWCVDWSLRVNGSKCGVIHFRRKGEERSKASFSVGQEAIRMVQEYKYL